MKKLIFIVTLFIGGCFSHTDTDKKNLNAFKAGIDEFVIKDNKLYYTTTIVAETNYFYCLDNLTKQQLWVNEIAAFCASPPVVLDDIIYVCTYIGHIYAYTLEGKLLWSNRLDGSFHSMSYNPLNHNLYVGTVTSGFFEYEKKTGKVIRNVGKATYHISLPFFIKDKMIIAGLKEIDNDTVNFGENLVCFETKSQKRIWKRKVYKEANNIHFYENYLYCLDSIKTLHKIDYKTGKDIWLSNLNPTDTVLWSWYLQFEKDKIFYGKENYGKEYTYLLIDINTGKIEKEDTKASLQKLGYLLGH